MSTNNEDAIVPSPANELQPHRHSRRRRGPVRQLLSDLELSGAQRLSLSSVGPFGLFLSILICFVFTVSAQAGRCLPLVSSPNGTRARPTRKTRADIATGIPIV